MDADDPQVIARAIFSSPHILNAIRSSIAEWYEAEENRKRAEAEHGGGFICGAPTKAEAIRGGVIEAVESMSL